MIAAMLCVEQRDGLRGSRRDGGRKFAVDGGQRVVRCGLRRHLPVDERAELGDEFRRDRQAVVQGVAGHRFAFFTQLFNEGRDWLWLRCRTRAQPMREAERDHAGLPSLAGVLGWMMESEPRCRCGLLCRMVAFVSGVGRARPRLAPLLVSHGASPLCVARASPPMQRKSRTTA